MRSAAYRRNHAARFAPGSGANVGAARIIDLADETKPVVISNMRLQVNQEKDQAGEQNADPGASELFQGYEAHYCTDPLHQGAFAMAAPAFSPRANEYWYSDGNLGFYVVRTTAAAKRSPALDATATPPKGPVTPPPIGAGGSPGAAEGVLPTTGLPLLLPGLALGTLGAFSVIRRRRRGT